ncbi:MAG TPA: quinolinate phosphoribosyl transferase [Solirubrobacterales bacterium]|nr:quinolinate phosphoribosyl transferase [Solirubrobacterales bacterium]
MTAERERLAPETFRLPVEKIRDAYYSDTYFALTKELLEGDGKHPQVTMQVFAKRAGLLGGIDEAIAVLRLCSGRRRSDGGWEDGWPRLRVSALHEGDEIEPWETVMTIEGDYSLFAHLETVYLGTLARRSLVMSNVRRVVDAADGKSVLFFPARHDHWLVQTGDGWAAHVAGAIGVSTDANASWWGGRGTGTIPHALIAVYGGDTVAAARAYAARFAAHSNIICLVDFHNDSVGEAVKVADALGDDLWGVRLDTAENVVDKALADRPDADRLSGVTPELARAVRDGLDAAGHQRVKIVVSGGFDAEKIERFIAAEAPIDSFGVGSSLIRGSFDFTADVVELDGKPAGKAGRELRPNPRLRVVV